MPAPIKYKCPSCKGESDMEDVRCLSCTMHDLIKSQNFKHLLREYRTKE
jgi:hypothetical protein